MAVVGMKQLLEAGVHFGHQTRRWNPKMKPFIYTERNGIHIIDLQKTVNLLERAYEFVEDVTRNGGRVLFVGTKRQAQEAVAEEAGNAGQFYVNQRWLGGLLTNFNTIQQRLRRLEELEQMRDTGQMAALPKKEQLKLTDEYNKLQKILGGIRGMRRLPDALFVIDTRKEHIAIHEAQRLDIPIVALLDTNSDPDEVDYPIPANDDAIRAVRLLSSKIAEAAQRGATERESTLAKEEAEEGFEPGQFQEYTFEPEGYDAGLDFQEESPLAEQAAAEAEEQVEAETTPPGSGESDPVAETVEEQAPGESEPAETAQDTAPQEGEGESDPALAEAAAAETNPA